MSTVYGDVGTDSVKYGLETAQDWLKNNQTYDNPYPAYTDRQAPTTMEYGASYAENQSPYQQVGGIATDWGQFQNDMRQTVYDAYDQNLNDINGAFASNGLYGSYGQGMHDDALQTAGQGLMSGLLSADQTAMDLYGQDLDRRDEQNLNAWKTGLTEAERQNTYDTNRFAYDYDQAQNATDFYNSENARLDDYNQTLWNLDYTNNRQAFQDALSLATGGAPGASAALDAQTQADIASANSDAATTTAWGSALGGVAGGLLGSDGFWDMF